MLSLIPAVYVIDDLVKLAFLSDLVPGYNLNSLLLIWEELF